MWASFKHFSLLPTATFALWLAYLPASQAALSLGATRVVFDSDKRSVSLIVRNPGTRPFAVQTWVNTAADDTTTAVPLLTAPPLFRLDPENEQQVQINGLPNDLPTDRESLFFFNVQEIPQVETNNDNVLAIALRTRIKLFYRPVQLQGDPMDRLGELRWAVQRIEGKPHLTVDNPTPFHLSFSRLEVSGGGRTLKPKSAPMVAPLSRQVYAFDDLPSTHDLRVTFSAINDYGGYSTAHSAPLRPAL